MPGRAGEAQLLRATESSCGTTTPSVIDGAHQGTIKLTDIQTCPAQPYPYYTKLSRHRPGQWLDPERAAAGREHNERVQVPSIGPTPQQRALHTIGIEERHAILTPRLANSDKRKLAIEPRMKRVGHTNSPLPRQRIRRS